MERVFQIAKAAESPEDFLHKLRIALKEAQETRFWLRTMRESELCSDPEVAALFQECDELVRILNVIIANTKNKMNG